MRPWLGPLPEGAPSPYPEYNLSAISIPSTTSPIGLNPCLSRNTLLPVLMKICVVLVLGPAVAKVRVPRLLLTLTESSLILDLHRACLVGSPLMPNWQMNPGRTLKIRQSSKNPISVNFSKRVTPFGAHSGLVWTTIFPVLPGSPPTFSTVNSMRRPSAVASSAMAAKGFMESPRMLDATVAVDRTPRSRRVREDSLLSPSSTAFKVRALRLLAAELRENPSADERRESDRAKRLKKRVMIGKAWIGFMTLE
mmetsp:Transcript_8189/g.12077  ORF Transcript_8189/g.12077 Transcript_8189/m.12077 type:complete len:252 (+) Transcript_8189:168-923(+)